MIQEVLAGDGHHRIVLPISSKRSSSIIVGMRCMGAGCVGSVVSAAPGGDVAHVEVA